MDKIVYLPVGQRGAGKSSYCNKIIDKQPEISLISRDDVLIKYYGSANTSPDSCNYPYIAKIIYRLLRLKLSSNKDVKILFDYFTQDSEDRKKLIEAITACGATKVIALYFITPLELVDKWFWQKPDIARSSEKKDGSEEKNLAFYPDFAPRFDYDLFHDLAYEIDSDGFNQVIRVNPTDDLIKL